MALLLGRAAVGVVYWRRTAGRGLEGHRIADQDAGQIDGLRAPGSLPGKDALGEGNVKVDFRRWPMVTGEGASTDVIEGSARRLLERVNRFLCNGDDPRLTLHAPVYRPSPPSTRCAGREAVRLYGRGRLGHQIGAFGVLGKQSRPELGVPQRMAIRRSKPSAIPPCGGAPSECFPTCSQIWLSPFQGYFTPARR